MKLRTAAGLGAVTLVVAGMLASGGGMPFGRRGVDTSERRKYTVVATTHTTRAIISLQVDSSVRGKLINTRGRQQTVPWKRTVWAEAGETLTIVFVVRTYGDHQLGVAPWARCEIQGPGGRMADTEVDQLPKVGSPDAETRQAQARCSLPLG